ncbi:MAG TPA: protein kinase [Blastocatellia bacterium]|nr:protein kinase [Blastocatellia bacterium]
MKAERWQRIEELFQAALGREGAERAAWLAAACAGDDGLRGEVESLLAALDEAGSFMETPAAESAVSTLTDARATQLTTAVGPSGSASDPRSDMPAGSAVGRRIGHYDILSLLGVGGMGEVYLAYDAQLDRRIALKLLPLQFTADPELVERFKREARAASATNHPNIITIYEIGQEADVHFIATEFVDGPTLRQRLTDGRMALGEIIAIALQIAGALEAAHATGIAHRDIKPENIMLRPDGLVKVLDFGLAKLVGAPGQVGDTETSARGDKEKSPPSAPHTLSALTAPSLSLETNPGVLMGTVAYLSPEQLRREKIDHRTDIFSLGIMLYELVTCERPFTGSDPATLFDAILRQEPAPITGLRPEAPAALNRLIHRMLEKDRAFRYQTAAELRADLQQLARELETKPTDAPTPTRTRRLAWGWKLALGLALVAALAVVWPRLLEWRQGSSESGSLWSRASAVRLTDGDGPELFPSLAPDGRTLVYASYEAGNWDIWRQEVDQPARARKRINLTRDSTVDDTQPAFSPDGQWIAFRSERNGGGIFVMNASGEQVRQIVGPGYYFHPAWSHDGREIICTRENVIRPDERNAGERPLWVVNVDTGALRPIPSNDAAQPQWSPHGHRIAYWGTRPDTQRDIWTRPAQGGEPVAVTNDEAPDWNPIWSPDGRYLYFVSERKGSMNLWYVALDERTGQTRGEPELIATSAVYSQHPTLSRDGRRLAYVQTNPRKNLNRIAFDPQRGIVIGTRTPITRGSRWATDMNLSPDGQSLAYTSVGEKQEDLFLLRSDGAGEPIQLTNDAAKDRGPRFSPNGQRLAFYSTRSGPWEIWTINLVDRQLQRLTFTDGAKALLPIWSPKGDSIVYTLHPGRPFLLGLSKPWAEQPPQPLLSDAEPSVRFWPTDWSDDGRQLIGVGQAGSDAPAPRLSSYSFASRQFEHLLTEFDGRAVLWLNDRRRLLFRAGGKLYLIDTKTRKPEEVYSVAPNHLTRLALSSDNRLIYFAMEEAEADIWLLSR